MTIDKAIRILTPGTTENDNASYQEFEVAEGLGIEALKEIRRHRRPTNLAIIRLLPGETEE